MMPQLASHSYDECTQTIFLFFNFSVVLPWAIPGLYILKKYVYIYIHTVIVVVCFISSTCKWCLGAIIA